MYFFRIIIDTKSSLLNKKYFGINIKKFNPNLFR